MCGQSLLKREAWVTLYTLRIDPPHAAPCGSDMKNHAGERTGKNNIRLSMFVITSTFTGGRGDGVWYKQDTARCHHHKCDRDPNKT